MAKKPWLKNFFFPPENSTWLVRILPFIALTLILLVVAAAGTTAWEYTNSPKFCGLTCHTMPPQYTLYLRSAHSNVSCEDCHLGRDTLGKMIPGKIKYSWQTGSALVFQTYVYPIVAKDMIPARQACENCHFPQSFNGDKLVELKRFGDDAKNTATIIDLIMKTRGGSAREGLGFGIHWHTENPVYFYATDASQQDIPYIKYTKADGSVAEYIDVEANFDPKTIKPEKLQTMDCITCHNRVSHNVTPPEEAIDQLLERGLVSTDLPEFHRVAFQLLTSNYASNQEAQKGIAGLTKFYQDNYADFYAKNTAKVEKAVKALQDVYNVSVFSEQKINWYTHPDNTTHKDSPGCFRCHDGKHTTVQGETIRLECNLCHSIPLVSKSTQFLTNIEISRGPEPSSHKNTNWINLHRTVFDSTCQNCHTVDDPGGTSDTSFCSNSACHGTSWKFAGFNAPKLREALKQAGQLITPTPKQTAAPTAAPTQPAGGTMVPQPTSAPSGKVTYAVVGPILDAKCGSCHGSSGIKGISLNSYANIMKTPNLIKAGDPAGSQLVRVQSGSEPHFGQLSGEELDTVKKWISDGAMEK